ncbi:MAG TPA: glycosyltransferase [Pirellulales bacterium]
MLKITIVIPCYNEAKRLQIAEYCLFVKRHERIKFLMVNDGSSDETLSILDRLATSHRAHFEVLDLGENCGKAEAVRRGVLHAAQDRPEAIGFWDADLATPLCAIPDFSGVLDRQPDLMAVIGVRVPLMGHDIRRRPIRRWLAAEFSQVVSLVFGQRFHDTQCGAKLFRVMPETLAGFSRPFASRWIFDVELLARLKQMLGSNSKAKLCEAIYEFPLDAWQDVAGSKLKRGDFFKAIGELMVIWWRYLRPGAAMFVPDTATMKSSAPEPVLEKRRAA